MFCIKVNLKENHLNNSAIYCVPNLVNEKFSFYFSGQVKTFIRFFPLNKHYFHNYKNAIFYFYYKNNAYYVFLHNKLFLYQPILPIKLLNNISRRSYFFFYVTHILVRFGLLPPLGNNKKYW